MTWQGQVAGIFITEQGGAAMRSLAEVMAVAGVGLEGDRYATGGGAFSSPDDPGKHVTLIESEALEAAARDYGVALADGDSRRNIVTAGVPLNHLVDVEFTVGATRLRGVKLCEPCGYLEEKTGQKVIRALRHRGGLNAEIIDGGPIRVGDPVAPV
ncbi:MAG TPA: MOSC domain-containing protein [Egibacteraceae bacterium]|nr:MOSC domain-containing protein [Egibacteraceae bacterium]